MIEMMWGKGGSGIKEWQPSCAYFHGFLNKSRDIVDKAAAAGRVTYCWTVDEQADVQLCADLGVRWVATNRPAKVRDWLVTVD